MPPKPSGKTPPVTNERTTWVDWFIAGLATGPFIGVIVTLIAVTVRDG